MDQLLMLVTVAIAIFATEGLKRWFNHLRRLQAKLPRSVVLLLAFLLGIVLQYGAETVGLLDGGYLQGLLLGSSSVGFHQVYEVTYAKRTPSCCQQGFGSHA